MSDKLSLEEAALLFQLKSRMFLKDSQNTSNTVTGSLQEFR
ncbi:unnamed protein product [Paramecium sonneborni]|uniref:Uncharacterized protein n=1 Tax=Paramecium sonneborni TaxID=65129 RepID=A0A8S1LZF1_9CILI|nr:unnamed protein product [Paramecium sonneborni]CAD8071435.1 unnamed protein product [Paramecium sonneborni]